MTPEQAKQFGAYLRRSREERGMSARSLARRVNLNFTQVLRLEQGSVRSPKADILAKIADNLDLPLADLYGLAGYPTTAELPNFRPYLRTKYRDELTDDQVTELEDFLERLRKKHGSSGPSNFEDEFDV